MWVGLLAPRASPPLFPTASTRRLYRSRTFSFAARTIGCSLPITLRRFRIRHAQPCSKSALLRPDRARRQETPAGIFRLPATDDKIIALFQEHCTTPQTVSNCRSHLASCALRFLTFSMAVRMAARCVILDWFLEEITPERVHLSVSLALRALQRARQLSDD